MDRLAQTFLGKSAAAALLQRIDFEVGVA